MMIAPAENCRMKETDMQKKYLITLLICYLMWGFQPLYWNLYGSLDSLFLMAVRTFWCCALTVGILAAQKRLNSLWALLRDKKTLRYLLPATLMLLIDWTVYTVAVRTGHVIDASFGYYLVPLVTFFFGIFLFREHCRPVQIVALLLAVCGVVVSAFGQASFSWYTVILALAWSAYMTLQKLAGADAILSIAAETLLVTPLMLLFILFFRMGDNGMASVDALQQLYFIGAGVVTALPMLLFSDCVVKMPLSAMSFFQYLSPTFAVLSGLIMGEKIGVTRWISFIFIGAAILIFTVSSLLLAKKNSEIDSIP